METLLLALLDEHALTGTLLEMKTVFFFPLTFKLISNPVVLSLLCSSTISTLGKGYQNLPFKWRI